MIEEELPNFKLTNFERRNYDDPNHPNYDDPNGPYYTLDAYGRPLAEKHRTRRLRVREVYASRANWTPEQCLTYFVELGILNPDGTVAEIYTLPYEYGPFAGKE
jgi:hypothetical protein